MSTINAIFTKVPYSVEQIPLASLIPDRNNPNQNQCPTQTVGREDWTKVPDENFSASIAKTTNSSFKAMLTKIFSLGLSGKSKENHEFESSIAFKYQLKQPTAIFNQLCDDGRVRDWLDDKYRNGQKVHFIDGYYTLVDSHANVHHSKEGNLSGRAIAPVGAIAGVDPIPGGIMDVDAELDHDGQLDVRAARDLVGERIYAISFRKIRLRHDHVLRLADPVRSLGKPRWVTTFRTTDLKRVEVTEADVDDVTKSGNNGPGDPVTFKTPNGQETFLIFEGDDEEEEEGE